MPYYIQLEILLSYSKNHLLCTFDTHLNYANLIWGQNLNVVSRIVILQKKTLRIMNFQSRDYQSSLLFKCNHFLKFEDKILIENILFIHKSLNNLLPPIFKNWFTFCSDVHNYQTASSASDKIFKRNMIFVMFQLKALVKFFTPTKFSCNCIKKASFFFLWM